MDFGDIEDVVIFTPVNYFLVQSNIGDFEAGDFSLVIFNLVLLSGTQRQVISYSSFSLLQLSLLETKKIPIKFIIFIQIRQDILFKRTVFHLFVRSTWKTYSTENVRMFILRDKEE